MNVRTLFASTRQPGLISSISVSSASISAQAKFGTDRRGYKAEEYLRYPDHVARTQKGEQEDSYILVLSTDRDHHKYVTGFRDRYFPKDINKLEAHVALFRALPGSELRKIVQDINEVCEGQQAFKIIADQPFRMHHGIGIHIKAGPAEALFKKLKIRWRSFLSNQDQSFHAHYTIQNKVNDSQQVLQALRNVKKEFKQSEGTATGLALYRYTKGVWKDGQTFRFRDREPEP